jgi:hypothetical protein
LDISFSDALPDEIKTKENFNEFKIQFGKPQLNFCSTSCSVADIGCHNLSLHFTQFEQLVRFRNRGDHGDHGFASIHGLKVRRFPCFLVFHCSSSSICHIGTPGRVGFTNRTQILLETSNDCYRGGKPPEQCPAVKLDDFYRPIHLFSEAYWRISFFQNKPRPLAA